MEQAYLTQEDIVFLGTLLQQSKSKNVITAYTKILIEARKNGVKDKAQKVLCNEDLKLSHTSMSTFTLAGNSLLTEGVISIDNIPQHQQDYFRLNNDQKQAAIFGMVAMKEGMFNLQQVNQILAKWSKEYTQTQCHIAKFAVENRFIEGNVLQTLFKKAGEIEEGLGRVQFREGVLQVGASVPKNFGRYEIEQEIARGGMGIVYKAYDPSFQRTVALKVLIRGEGSSQLDVARFEREARSVYKIQHEHIIPVYDLGSENGMPYFAMKFVSGHGLDREKVPMHYRKAIKLLTPIANALHTAHQTGIIHRDIKPANIMIDNEGKPWLTDFGLAKDKEGIQELTQAGSFMGTPAYMAPEQIDHPESVDAKCDIYALGVVFYLLIVGKPPYDANTFPALLRKISEGKAKPPHLVRKEIPEEISRICMRAIAKKKKDRYSSAQRFAKDLENAAGKAKPSRASGATSRSSVPKKARKKAGRRRGQSKNTNVIITVASIFVMILFLVIFASSSSSSSEDNTYENEFEYTQENNRKKDKTPKKWENDADKNQNTNKQANTDKNKNTNKQANTDNNQNSNKQNANNNPKVLPRTKMSPAELGQKLQQVTVYVRQKNYALAEKYVDQILKDFPKNSQANYEKSVILVHKKQYSEALKHVDIALNIPSPPAGVISYKGHILKMLNRFQEAAQFYTKAINKRKCFHCYNERALIYAQHLHEYDKALADLSLIIDEKPNDRVSFTNVGRVLEQMGDPYKSITFFTNHIKKYPQSAHAHFERGWVHLSLLKNFDKALKDFEKVVKINPGYVEAQFHIGQISLRNGDHKKALKIAKEVSKKDPRFFAAHALKGDCYIIMNQKKRAIKSWKKAIGLLQFAPPPIRGQVRADLENKIRRAGK
ncbi:serine/threonine-protein kinase [Candidatus Uabimicrobium amorphum]|uniref:Protein kinase n=1 Tax=Uabimicrobium amorphum TaxID=2596890 RepID=A0A5S9F1H7_UABAM|nr:serine/threonine-protein kinase [Candidatus Uabimicrobium amorphum]BBM82627.1 protein kinase [Candidatus Uabimicrobium amorphum]